MSECLMTRLHSEDSSVRWKARMEALDLAWKQGDAQDVHAAYVVAGAIMGVQSQVDRFGRLWERHHGPGTFRDPTPPEPCPGQPGELCCFLHLGRSTYGGLSAR